MDPHLLRQRLVREQLQRQRLLRLHRLLEQQREQRALDEFFVCSVLRRHLDESRTPVPRLPDGELDMMHGFRRDVEGLDTSHHSTPGQESVQHQESFEQPAQSHGPQVRETDARVVNYPARRPFSAHPMHANLYLAHGDVSHIWPDAHPLGFTDQRDATLFQAHERPPDGPQGVHAGPEALNNQASGFPVGRGMDSNSFQAHGAPNSSESHVRRWP
jgi:hypothetical protein